MGVRGVLGHHTFIDQRSPPARKRKKRRNFIIVNFPHSLTLFSHLSCLYTLFYVSLSTFSFCYLSHSRPLGSPEWGLCKPHHYHGRKVEGGHGASAEPRQQQQQQQQTSQPLNNLNSCKAANLLLCQQPSNQAIGIQRSTIMSQSALQASFGRFFFTLSKAAANVWWGRRRGEFLFGGH